MKKIRGSALIVIFMMLLGIVNPSVFAAEELVIPINETFNQYATNTTPTDWTIVGAKTKVIETDAGNKALRVENVDVNSSIWRQAGSFGDYYVLCMDVKTEGAPLNLSVGLGNHDTPMIPIKIENNAIMTHDNKSIGSVRGNQFTTIAMVVSKGKFFTVYIDGKKALSDWRMPSEVPNGELVLKKKDASEAKNILYIDNIRMYQANRIYRCIPNAAMNPEQVDQFNIDDDTGDYLYFDSHDMNTTKNSYDNNFHPDAKDNEIVYGRLEKTNPNRDESIILKKTTANDCFFDIWPNKHAFMRSSKRYTRFLIEGDFKLVDMKGATATLLLRDGSVTPRADQVTAMFRADGSLYLADGSTYPGMALNNKWMNLKIYFDVTNHMIDAYVDGKAISTNVPVNANLNTLMLVRFGFDTGAGSGEIYVKDFRVTGLMAPYVNGVETKTSIFPEVTEIEDYLKDKVAFSGYSALMTVNGEKTKIKPAPIVENNELYVPAHYVNQAFGLAEGSAEIGKDGRVSYDGKTVTLSRTPREQDGTLYVPVLAFGSEVLGKQTFHHKTGLFLLADSKLALDSDSWDYLCMRPFSAGITVLSDFDQLNSYLSFERPSAEQIREDFNRTTNNGAMHPRIFATKDTFDKIKANRTTDATLGQMVTTMLDRAEIYASRDVLTYKFDDAMRMLNTANESVARMESLGFAWQITGDRKWGDRAWKDLEALCKFPDFNTSHIIDSGTFNMALAIGYDWFYDYLTEEQKKTISDTILNNSLKDLADGYYGRIASTSDGSQVFMAFKWTSNYNTIINGGALNAALAVAEVAPDYCFDVIEKALRSIEYTMFNFAPGGGWAEGPGYWNYTWNYLNRAMSTVKSSLGSDYSILDFQGACESADYFIALCGPQGMNNYHDTNTDNYFTTSINYAPLAKFYQKPDAFNLRRQHLKTKPNQAELFDVIFYDFDAVDGDVDLPLAMKTNGTESFAFRETYDWTKGGMYVGAHFGATSGYHAQNDTGTFVYDILGKRWAMDLGQEDYNLTNELGIPTWQTYRRRAEGHNICVINPGQQYNQIEGKFAQVTDFESNQYGGYAIANMDGVYADADTMKSGFYVGDNMRSLTVRHEIDLNKKSTVYWFMHTQANVTVRDNNEVILSQGTDSVNLRFATNAQNVQVAVMDAKPLPTSPNPPQQNQNEGVRKVAIKMEANGHLDLTVKLAPMGEAAAVTPILDVPMAQWKLPEAVAAAETPNLNFKVMYGGEEVNGPLPCYEGEPLPEVQVITENPDALVEIQQAATVDDLTTIKVTDSASGMYKFSAVDYIEASGKSLRQFDQLPVASVAVSSTPEPENHKDNMLDESYSTRWTCMGKGENAIFDLGEVKEVDGVAIAFWKGNVRQYFFDILVSENGTDYQSVISEGESDGSTENLEVFDFEKIKARYIKFVGNGNTETNATSVNSNILEFRVLKNKYE